MEDGVVFEELVPKGGPRFRVNGFSVGAIDGRGVGGIVGATDGRGVGEIVGAAVVFTLFGSDKAICG